jgi:hypothetical protein
MIYLLLETDVDFKEQARYVLRHLFKVLGCDVKEIQAADLVHVDSGLVVYYGNALVRAHQSVFLLQITTCHYFQTLTDLKRENIRTAGIEIKSLQSGEFKSSFIYFFYQEMAPLRHILYRDRELHSAVISYDERQIRCTVDIVASVFYFLNLEEEKHSPRRDSFHRFHKAYSLMGDDIYEKPLVDHYISLMDQFLRMAETMTTVRIVRHERWPSGIDAP